MCVDLLTSGGGAGVGLTADEEHAYAVVVTVAEAAGDAAVLLADHRLYHIVAHVDQRRPQGVPQPRARRIPLDTLLAQADEQVGELGREQPRGTLS